MKQVRFFFQLLIIIVGTLACSKESKFELTSNGQTNLSIIYDAAVDGEQDSAELLAGYLEKISGAAFQVKALEESELSVPHIRLKNNATGDHTVGWKVNDNVLTIEGGNTSYLNAAVFDFLQEELGCLWLAPGEEWIPQEENLGITADKNYSYAPDIKVRTVHSQLFYDFPDQADRLKVSTEAFPHYVPSARVHTFHRFMPYKSFYESHPEYYAWRNEKRIPTQLCLTNQEVVEIVKDSVASYFKRHPKATVLSVSQDDNTQYCQCDKCTASDEALGGPSGTMVKFVNQIAQAFPEKTISTLAYQYTRKAPTIKPLSNVLITLCSIECDRSKSIEEGCVDFAQDLRDWTALTDNIRIWDYTTQFTNFLAPFPNLHTLEPNIRFFRAQKANWVFEQHSRQFSDLFELRSYVMARLLWNPDESADELIQEFCAAYYGAGGDHIVDYVQRMKRSLEEYPDFFLFLYGDPSQAFDKYLNADLLNEYDGFFNKALDAVAGDEVTEKRILKARLGLDFAILEACRKNISDRYSLTIQSGNGKRVVNPFLVDRLNTFETVSREAGIRSMNEMGFSLDDYIRQYQGALALAQKPNKALGMKVALLTSPKKYANEDPQTLTDGALGGNGFYANWLGFEGENMIAVIDLGEEKEISSISTNFLQVTNHVVFFPVSVHYSVSVDGKEYQSLIELKNEEELHPKSKVNDIRSYSYEGEVVKTRYVKVEATSMQVAPFWHHASGLPSWIFADEVIID